MTRYRWITPVRKGRWHESRKEAGDAAVRAGLATRDEHSGTLYLHTLTWIEVDRRR